MKSFIDYIKENYQQDIKDIDQLTDVELNHMAMRYADQHVLDIVIEIIHKAYETDRPTMSILNAKYEELMTRP